MNRRLILIVIALWLIAYAAHAQAPLSFGSHDAGAARKNLSNVTPATGRAALGLGTMAVEAATDYVATDTFTGHTGATGSSVHGLGTISTKADTDYVATSALALRLDTTNASISNNLDVAGDVGAATVNGMTPGTMVAVNSPVPVANGGTGKTTAAEALAALGGASLNGSSTVAFNASIYNNADGDIADLVAMANGFNPRRWGIKIAKATDDPDARVEYIYDAVGMTPAAMNYTSGEFEYGDWKPFCDAVNRPVMLNPNGTVAYELDRNNQTLKRDGTASGISSTTHDLNAMSEFKRLWLKQYEDTDYHYIIFSNVQYDPDYRADAFTDASGNIRDRMYYAMYEGSYVAPRLRSLATGAVMTAQTGQVEIERAEANGAGWHINYKSQRDLITYLLWLISKSTYDMQKFGNGNSNSGAYVAPGALKSAGQFMGYNTTTQAVKVFFIENYWANYWKRMSGMLLALNGEIRTKLVPPYTQPPAPAEDFMPAGYANTGVVPSGTSGTHLKNAVVSPASGFLPAINGGAENTYYTCGMWYVIGTTIKWALVGGIRSYAGLCGAGTVSLGTPLSHPGSYIGAALSFLKSSS